MKTRLEKIKEKYTKDEILNFLENSLTLKDFWKQLKIHPIRMTRDLDMFLELESFLGVNIKDCLLENKKQIKNLEFNKVRICKNPKCKKEFHWTNELKINFCSRECAAAYSSSFVNKKNISKSIQNFKIFITCKNCQKEFEVSGCYSKKYRERFLCDECYKLLNKIDGNCKICGKPLKNFKNKTCSKECSIISRATTFKKSIKDKNLKIGGLRAGSGRGKSGWYKNYWCDSSWELAWVIYNLDHNIKFKRFKGYFLYTFENKSKKYFPDFELEDGTIIEIK